jgi:predicted ester cyclase
MSAPTTSEIARRWFDEVCQKRNRAAIRELTPENLIGHMAHGRIEGCEPFEAFHDEIIALLPDLRIEPEDIIAEGQQAAIRWRLTGTATGAGFGIQRTGQKVNVVGMSWFRIADGRIAEGWDAWDFGNAFAKLGEPA